MGGRRGGPDPTRPDPAGADLSGQPAVPPGTDPAGADPSGQPAVPTRAAHLARLLSGPAPQVAPKLLGSLLRARIDGVEVCCRLTEVEAYGGAGEDPGSHAYRGPTPRNASMFGAPGHWYVYFTYGMHWCLNLVCGPAGTAQAVLLRAGEVIEGGGHAVARRPGARPRELARGPARLTRALGVDGSIDGSAALDPGAAVSLALPAPGQAPDPASIRTGPRVGVGGPASSWPWRFWLDGDPTVSTYRAHIPRRRGTGG